MNKRLPTLLFVALIVFGCNADRTPDDLAGDDAGEPQDGANETDVVDATAPTDADADGADTEPSTDTLVEDAAPHDADGDADAADVLAPDADADVAPTCDDYRIVCAERSEVAFPFTSERVHGEYSHLVCRITPEIPFEETTWITDEMSFAAKWRDGAVEWVPLGHGDYWLEASVPLGNGQCALDRVEWTVEPPSRGLYFVATWDDLATEENSSDFVVGLRMVREGHCFDSYVNSVFDGSFDQGWGGTSRDDDPHHYPGVGAPGAAVITILSPAPDERIHMAFSTRFPPAVEPSLARVFISMDGEVFLDEEFVVASGDFRFLGALSDGAWVPSYHAGRYCPTVTEP